MFMGFVLVLVGAVICFLWKLACGLKPTPADRADALFTILAIAMSVVGFIAGTLSIGMELVREGNEYPYISAVCFCLFLMVVGAMFTYTVVELNRRFRRPNGIR